MQISVIFITYRPGGIDILADSLYNQSFKNYELIVVDDYKVDRRELVKQYLKNRDIPVTYLGPSKPKCFPEIAFNVSNAINTGFLLSTKEIVILLQDYIWLPPDCLEKFARHQDLFNQNYCVVLPGQIWETDRARNNNGLISIWDKEWQGPPEKNDCKKSGVWVPAGWEFSCIAWPWNIIKAMNGYPEYLDCHAAHLLEPLVRWFESAGAKPYVDKGNFMHIVDHREWQPRELWHQAKRNPKGSTEYIERPNCFDLKKHVRGKAYWLNVPKAPAEIFDKPEYWCGDLGYRTPGYADFKINDYKTAYVLSKRPKGRVLDVGCAMGYLVARLRKRDIDAWGIDCSQYAYNHAPQEVKPYLKVGDATQLPWPDKFFDMVISFSTFEHLLPEILPKAISEAARVADRGIIAVTPSEDPYFDEDITHQTRQPLAWWASQFPPEFEIRDDADEEWLKVIGTLKVPIVNISRIEWIRSKVTIADSILEVGCAENPVWRDTNYRVTTVDEQINPELQIFPDYQAKADNLPFSDNTFDIVSEGELLEHVADPQKVLKEAVRVASKKIILTVPDEWLWPEELKPFWNPGHVRFYNADTFTEELKQTGLPFKIERIQNGPWVWLGAELYCGEEGAKAPSDMVKINLGSFVDTIGAGWENWDILPIQQHIKPGHKFKQWDVRKGLPLTDKSVDLIRISHLIEHLTLEEAKSLLAEIYRVLKPGGLARISTPDARLIIKHYIANDMSYFNQIQPPEYIAAPTDGEKLSRILFSGDYSHKAIYSFEMLKSFLEQAGFQKIYQVSPRFSYSEVMKNETEDQHTEVSLCVEAIK